MEEAEDSMLWELIGKTVDTVTVRTTHTTSSTVRIDGTKSSGASSASEYIITTTDGKTFTFDA